MNYTRQYEDVVNRTDVRLHLLTVACNCLIVLTILSRQSFYIKPFYVGKQVMYRLFKKEVFLYIDCSMHISNGLLQHSIAVNGNLITFCNVLAIFFSSNSIVKLLNAVLYLIKMRIFSLVYLIFSVQKKIRKIQNRDSLMRSTLLSLFTTVIIDDMICDFRSNA